VARQLTHNRGANNQKKVSDLFTARNAARKKMCEKGVRKKVSDLFTEITVQGSKGVRDKINLTPFSFPVSRYN